jgi:hypothetical protein
MKPVFKVSFSLIFLVLCFGFFLPRVTDQNQLIDQLFAGQLQELTERLIDLERACDQKSGQRQLKIKFRNARSSYKKSAVLIDYFHPFESR